MTREEAIDLLDNLIGMVEDNHNFDYDTALQMAISALSENKGEWIYNKSIYNWKCSRCGQAPKTMGYVGTADFMTTHFKFCNHCGARMEGCEE